MGLSDILAMLMQHGGVGAPPMMMSPGGSASPASAAPVSMLPGTNLPTPQPLAHMNTPSLGQVASQMPQMAADKPSLFSSLGSALQSHTASDPGLQLNPSNYGLMSQSNGLHALLQQILGQ